MISVDMLYLSLMGMPAVVLGFNLWVWGSHASFRTSEAWSPVTVHHGVRLTSMGLETHFHH